MPAVMLTDALVRAAKPGELWDARVPGLILRTSERGVRAWSLRYRPKDSNSNKRLPLGRYPEVTLALARQRAQEKRVAVSDGRDPQGERQANREAERRALTFDLLADAYLERYAKPHKRSWANDELYLRAHVRGTWGPRPARKITRAEAAALLDTIAKTAPTSANRTQSILSRLFNWAIESGLLELNPVGRMPKRAKEKSKDRVLAPVEIRILWQALHGDGSIAAALRSLLLTGLRPGEVAGLAISEVADLDNPARARIEFGAGRMKGGRAHVHPLAPMALAIMQQQLERAVEGQAHVFPSAMGDRGPVARHSLSQGLRRIIKALPDADIQRPYPTPHDFRRTVATGLAALGIAREDRLAVLGHAPSDVHGIFYDRHDRFNEKRRALEAWESHVADIVGVALTKTADNVVKLGRARR